MSETIRVHLVRFKGRENYIMRYVDPLTGKQVARSTRTAKRRDAERAAAKWEAELRDGRYQKPSLMTWAEFRERYERERLASLAPNTLESADSAFNHLERVVAPKLLASLTSQVLSTFVADLLADGMKPTTLASHLRSIQAALNWAARKKLMREAPEVELPKSGDVDRAMRGRPITTEEYERMLAATPKARKREPAKWQRFLTGLWLSGLRISEALQLSWDADAAITIRLDGKYPALRILSEAQKAKRDEVLPIAPDFAEFLLATPPGDRHGLVFGIEGPRPGTPLSTKRVSRYVSAIGEAARVVVDPNDLRPKIVAKTDKKTGEKTRETIMVPRYATAHDLRRAFGTRWSKRVMPVVLRQLMRHRSIDTTMAYYVQHSADDVSAVLWEASGIPSGIQAQNQPAATPQQSAAAGRNALPTQAL